MTRRVVVTGVGALSPAGVGVPATWARLCDPGDVAPQRIRRVDDPAMEAANTNGPDGPAGAPWLAVRDRKRLDRFAVLAVLAAAEACAHAGLARLDLRAAGDRAGVVIGTGMGGLPAFQAAVIARLERGDRRVSPFTVPLTMPNAAAAAVSLYLGVTGPAEAVTTACAAGAHSIAHAARLVAHGELDVALAGGAESCLDETTVAAFTVMTALSPTGVSRPFDRGRDGFAAAEAAAVLVLEPLDNALSRGATPLAELLGHGSTADAHHLTAPPADGSGAARCMRAALRSAGLRPDDVAHVNAHGTSTPLNDAAEAAALHAVFGERPPPVTSIKGVTGHTLGAAGALEAAVAVVSLTHARIPPTAVTADVDDLGIDVVLGSAREVDRGPVLSNSFGFGGHNATLVLGMVR